MNGGRRRLALVAEAAASAVTVGVEGPVTDMAEKSETVFWLDHWRAHSPTRNDEITYGGRGSVSSEMVCVVECQGPPGVVPEKTVKVRAAALKSMR